MITNYLKRIIDATLPKYSERIRNKKLTKDEIRIFYITKGKKVEKIIENAEIDLAKIINKFMEELE